MPQKTMLKATGIHNDPNQLTVGDGSLNVGENVVINRNDVIEPRRGFNEYGIFGTSGDRAKQYLVYKNRLLVHYGNTLAFNANEHNNTLLGNFQNFSGSYSELETGRRLRGIESNKNFYFTTNDGIKKISAVSATDLSTSANYIVDSGAIKALDVTGDLVTDSTGFLPPNSKVAYRVIWSYKDVNDNLIAGTPSSRLVITNYSTNTASVNLSFAIPQNINATYFYQVYRSAVITTVGTLTLSDIDPGDELQLVIEDFPTSAELTANTVTVEDVTPENLRSGGLFLYTNPNSGDGIIQANEPPPKAKDLTLYRTAVFYANTTTKAATTISLLGVDGMVSGTSSVTLGGQTYTFTGSKEKTKVDFNSYVGAIPSSLDGKYFTLNSASDKHKYYIWFDNSKTTQLIDFTNYIGTLVSDLKSKFFVLNTSDLGRKYYVWYDSTGTDTDPGLDATNNLTGIAGIRVNISSGVSTLTQLTTKTTNAITTNDISADFDVTNPTATSIQVQTSYFDISTITSQQNLLKGFVFTLTNPVLSDPAISGSIGVRVNISRGVTTKAGVAAALADVAQTQDSAGDFTTTYTPGNTYVEFENTNNGVTTNATIGTISTLVITIENNGTGEDAATNKVLLSAQISPSLAIDETARSLVTVINKNTSSTVYAFYTSGATDLPGQIFLQVRDIGTSTFNVIASDTTVGNLFNPSLPPAGATAVTGTSEIKPNRLYYSKVQQPEAVPLTNYVDVGPQDKEISRILALRESLFILKQDGVYRLTGVDGNYNVNLFDESTKIIAPDTAVVLNNQIYCLSNQGLVAISDTGVSILSKPLDYTFKTLTSSNYNYRFTSFGMSYETDRSYLLAIPLKTTDNVATTIFRYNTQTNTYTSFDLSKTCGIVNPGDDKMYLGPSDQNFVERERKLFNRTDYADRDFQLVIPANSVNGTILTLSSNTAITVGDALVQTQYVTINEFNQLLSKLDLDPSTIQDYYSSIKMNAGDSIVSKIIDLATKLDTDPGINQNDFVTSIGSFSDFIGAQTAFNIIINKLNLDTGTIFKNYLLSSGTKEFEVLIIGKESNTTQVDLQFSIKFMEGPVTVYEAVISTIEYAPETAGDPSFMKQFSEATMMFEDAGFSRATIGFKSDLSPGIDSIDFDKSGKGDFGFFIFSNNNWGGSGSGVPLRTYVPRKKQRCRYLQIQLIHSSAREKYSIFGISYTFRAISERAYR